MNRTRSNDRFARTRTGGSGSGRSGARSSAPRRTESYGRRRPAPQGEFALPVTTTPALPAIEAFAELAMPAPLLTALGHEGVTVPFPIQAATLPNTLAGRDVLGRGRTGDRKSVV